MNIYFLLFGVAVASSVEERKAILTNIHDSVYSLLRPFEIDPTQNLPMYEDMRETLLVLADKVEENLFIGDIICQKVLLLKHLIGQQQKGHAKEELEEILKLAIEGKRFAELQSDGWRQVMTRSADRAYAEKRMALMRIFGLDTYGELIRIAYFVLESIKERIEMKLL